MLVTKLLDEVVSPNSAIDVTGDLVPSLSSTETEALDKMVSQRLHQSKVEVPAHPSFA